MTYLPLWMTQSPRSASASSERWVERCVTNGPCRLPTEGGCCCGDCNDNTIAYHSRVSSGEPFYCPPDSGPDAVSCASTFTGSKGAYATDGS